jgi:fatty-acyl-CoA synthase
VRQRVPTIPEALLASAERGEGEYVFYLEDGAVSFSCAELVERALRAAGRLMALGIQPGDAVGVLGPNRPEWVVSAFAIWISGAVLVPVQIPLRVRDPDAFQDQLRSLLGASGCRRVLADPRLAALLPAELAVSWEERGGESAERPALPAADAPAVIQLTSGSTAFPKGALISHAAAMAQMDALRRGYRFEDGTPRTVLSWTPFFHDLGLFANLVHPAVAGSHTYHLPTERFAADPAEWLHLVERTRAEMTVAPPSAFGSALRAAKSRGERVDLSSLEVAYFAAEGVDPAVVGRMVEMATDFAFRPEALGATYGLAEAVMAVSYPRIGTGLHTERVSASELADAGVATPAGAGDGPVRLMISSGEPLMDVRIAGPESVLPERRVGEIQVRGASLMSGYVGAALSDPFVDGWLCTGDLGYLADGELYVTGRRKDLMIVMGHNYYPEDFEWAAARVDGVRPGRCAAFVVPGQEKAVVLVETSEVGESKRLAREVARTIADAVGVPPGDVVVLPPCTLQKTTSGKLRRAAMRDAYASGELLAVAG